MQQLFITSAVISLCVHFINTHSARVPNDTPGSLKLEKSSSNSKSDLNDIRDEFDEASLLKTKKPRESEVDVVVVGAGYSGLVTGRNLARSGYSVAVMEASDHLGGRSQRQLFSPPAANAPLWVDQGGMWVGPSQTSFLALLQEYDLPLYVSYHGVGNELLKWKDQRLYKEGTCWDCVIFPRNGESEIPGPMEEAVHDTKGEMKAGLRELVRVMKLFRTVVDTIDVEKPWTSPNAKTLDEMTFKAWAYNATSNELARQMFLLACSLQGAVAEPWWASALHIARQLAAAPQTERPEKWMIKGGAAQVPPLLAADIQKLGGKVLLKSPVHSIKQAGNHVSVHTEKDHIKAKAVVVAMPPHLAGRIRYDPPMPPARDQLTQRVFMGSIMKVVATYPTPFWREDPSTNFTIAFDPATSGPIRTIYDVTPPVEIGGGGSGVLAGFVIEDNPQLFPLSEEERKTLILNSFADYFGPKARKPTGFMMKNWAEQPFTGGAYTAGMPLGAWTSFGTAWSAPVGRIFWAGTEVSTRWPGYYDGAINSAHAAVEAVKEAVPEPSGVCSGVLSQQGLVELELSEDMLAHASSM